MAKCWLSVAVVIIGLGAPAWAQSPYLPNGGRPAVMPEPIPYGPAAPNPPSQTPAAAQAAAPAAAPQGADSAGPPELRGDMPNAWVEDVPTDPAAVYFSVGVVDYERQRLGHTPAAFFDASSGGVHTGNPLPFDSREVLNFHDINPRDTAGVQLLLGYHWDRSAIEVSGFYAGQSSSSKQQEARGSLDVPFSTNGNINVFPLGFEGDNGMWIDADLVKIRLQTSLASGEINYRWWLGSSSNFSWTIGARFLQVYERFGLFTGDDDLTNRDIFGRPDPTRESLYQVTANNRLCAPQLGLEWNQPISCWLAFSLKAKGAWGVNFLDVDTLLKRGDGFVGFTGHRSDQIFSQLYDFGVYADLSLRDNMRLRVGYNFMWALDVAEATAQFDYNLANRQGRTNNEGSIFFGGPAVELHILF
jgi:hypothetical protein